MPVRRSALARCLVAGFVVLAISAPVSAGASAQASTKASGGGSDRKHQLEAQIGEASKAEAAALAQLADIRDRKAQIDAQVAALDQQQAAAEARLAPLDAEAARLGAEYAALQAKVQETEAKLAEARGELARAAAGLYRSARRGIQYDSVFSSSPDSLIAEKAYLAKVSDKRRRLVQHVRGLRDDLVQQRGELETRKAQADAAAADARAVRDQIAQLRASIEPARTQAAQEQYLETQQINAIRANKSQYEAELAAWQATSDSIAARLRAIGGSGGGAPCQARPVPGAIVSGFGPRYHPILHYTRMHTGVDMHAGTGTPIHACRAGTVVIAGSQGGYGNCVVIDHGGGMATLYGHQSRLAVSEGEHVAAGQVIGYVGQTGLATGPHLHFEVRISGNPVDPVPYL
jgi:murein DD-endopeptidase MepM/ murein hydrolase activator NlpD